MRGLKVFSAPCLKAILYYFVKENIPLLANGKVPIHCSHLTVFRFVPFSNWIARDKVSILKPDFTL